MTPRTDTNGKHGMHAADSDRGTDAGTAGSYRDDVLRALVFVLLAGGAGALLNSISLPIVTGSGLVFGNAAYVLVAQRLRGPWAALAAALMSLPVWWQTQDWGYPLLFTLEAATLATLRRRQVDVLIADLLFWLLIGAPLVAWVIASYQTWPQENLPVVLMKHFLNSMIYCSAGAIIAELPGPGSQFGSLQQLVPRMRFRRRLVQLTTLALVFAGTLTTLAVTRANIQRTFDDTSVNLQHVANHLAMGAGTDLERHRAHLELIASALAHSADPDALAPRLLADARARLPGFTELRVEYEGGRVIAALPAEPGAGIAANAIGAPTTIALDVPWRDDENPAHPAGRVRATLDIARLAVMTLQAVGERDIDLVVVDRAGLVVYASERLGLKAGGLFSDMWVVTSGNFRGELVQLGQSRGAMLNLLRSARIDNGWRIYALSSYARLLASQRRQHFIAFGIVFASVLLCVLSMQRLAARISTPLEQIADDIRNLRAARAATLQPLPADSPLEIEEVHSALATAMSALASHNEKLEQAVAERTADLAAATAEAERASRAKSEFLASMSHELRTPMNAVLGFGQLLALDPALTSEQRESVDEIERAGKHLLDLINDVLDLAHIESGTVTHSAGHVPVAAVVEECFALLAARAATQHIRLQNDCAVDLAARTDRTRLKQILLNLVSNAVKYNREHGSVTVTTERAGAERLRIAVRDTGRGIPPERIAELFEPFNRLGAEAGPIEGTGVGLTITRRLVEEMGGSIAVESVPEAGSVFTVELPLDRRQPAAGLA